MSEQMFLQRRYGLQLLQLAIVFRLFQDRLKPAETTKKTKASDKADEFSQGSQPSEECRFGGGTGYPLNKDAGAEQ
jgi:hypothetical protein